MSNKTHVQIAVLTELYKTVQKKVEQNKLIETEFQADSNRSPTHTHTHDVLLGEFTY